MSSPLTTSRHESGTTAPDLTDRVRSLRLPAHTVATGGNSRLPWLLVILLGAASGFLGYREYQRLQSAPTTTSETSPAASGTTATETTTTKAATAGPGGSAVTGVAVDNSLALQVRGYIIPAHQILVSPKVSGMVTQLFIEEGQRVEKGQVLAEMEQVDYLTDLQRAQGHQKSAEARYRLLLAGTREEELRQAQAELAEAETQLELQKSEHERNVALRKTNPSLVTDSQFETTENQYRATAKRVERLQAKLDQAVKGAREQELESALAEVEQAKADVTKAKWRLDNCTIRAPISGTVLKKNAEEGNIVNPIAFNGSFSLCDLADLADLEVDLDVDERDVSKVYPRQACRIISPAYPERVYEGYVDRLLPIADRAQAAVPVRVKVIVPKQEEGVYLKPDMTANVTFLSQRYEPATGKPPVTEPPAKAAEPIPQDSKTVPAEAEELPTAEKQA